MKILNKSLAAIASVPFTTHLLIGVVIRLALIIYSEIHDQLFELKYTDIDYQVFTEGARGLLRGIGSRQHFAHINGTLVQIGSYPLKGPFDEPTYRYSPLIALLVVPNLYAFPAIGKILFAAMDIGCAPLQYRLLTRVGTPPRYASLSVALLWIYNPLPLIVSTRGSSDSIMSLLVLLVLFELSHRKTLTAGILMGIAIHVKLFPVIYMPSIYLYLTSSSRVHTTTPSKVKIQLGLIPRLSPNWEVIKFLVASVVSFSVLTGASFWAYGWIYLQEAWIYHFTRKDTAHNFSPYFYAYRILKSHNLDGSLWNLAAFLPQMISLVSLIALYSLRPMRPHPIRLYACLFFSTFAFVTLNKVCTSQYFLWYLTLLPLIAPYLSLSLVESLALMGTWLAAQAVWLFWAYLYEFRQLPVLGLVAAASVLFLCVNLCIMVRLMHKFVL